MRKPSSIAWLLAAARLIGSNPLPRTALIASAALAATLLPQESKAVTIYWDPTAGLGNGVGGTGTWGTTFSAVDTGSASLATAGTTDDVIFKSTAGVVTFTGTQTVGTLNFNSSGYTLQTSSTTAAILAFNALTIGTGNTLNIGDSTTANRTIGLNGNTISGGTLNFNGAQTGSAIFRVNFTTANEVISSAITLNSTGTGGVVTVCWSSRV